MGRKGPSFVLEVYTLICDVQCRIGGVGGGHTLKTLSNCSARIACESGCVCGSTLKGFREFPCIFHEGLDGLWVFPFIIKVCRCVFKIPECFVHYWSAYALWVTFLRCRSNFFLWIHLCRTGHFWDYLWSASEFLRSNNPYRSFLWGLSMLGQFQGSVYESTERSPACCCGAARVPPSKFFHFVTMSPLKATKSSANDSPRR